VTSENTGISAIKEFVMAVGVEIEEIAQALDLPHCFFSEAMLEHDLENLIPGFAYYTHYS
jgi:hypothetical protein